MNEWKDGWMNGRMHVSMYGCTRPTCGKLHSSSRMWRMPAGLVAMRSMDGRIDGWMDDVCMYVCVHYLWEVALVVQDVEDAGGLCGDQVDGRTD